VLPKKWPELFGNGRRGSEAEPEIRFLAIETGDECASFTGDQCASGVVPGLKSALVVPIDASTCH
jgi:hypothetical protein